MSPAPVPLPRRPAFVLAVMLSVAGFALAGRSAAGDTPETPAPPAAAVPQAAPEPAPQAESPAPPAQAPSPDIHPDAVSSFQVRAYKTSEKKLWKGLLQVLQEAGYPPEEIDGKGKRVKTSFVDFSSKDYSEEVADAAPRLGGDYHILQMSKVKLGKVSLEGVVSGGQHGASVLSLRARILVDGLDQRKRVRLLTDRRSSGVIESDFLRRLEDTLKLERQTQ
jgi:hypothetical protein